MSSSPSPTESNKVVRITIKTFDDVPILKLKAHHAIVQHMLTWSNLPQENVHFGLAREAQWASTIIQALTQVKDAQNTESKSVVPRISIARAKVYTVHCVQQ